MRARELDFQLVLLFVRKLYTLYEGPGVELHKLVGPGCLCGFLDPILCSKLSVVKCQLSNFTWFTIAPDL